MRVNVAVLYACYLPYASHIDTTMWPSRSDHAAYSDSSDSISASDGKYASCSGSLILSVMESRFANTVENQFI